MKLLNNRYIPPPTTDSQHEVTFIMTETERLALNNLIRRGRRSIVQEDPASGTVMVADGFLSEVLGVKP